MRRPTRGWLAAILIIAALSPLTIAADAPLDDGPSSPSNVETTPVVFVANSKAGTVHIVEAAAPYDVLRTVDVVPGGKPAADDPSLERDPAQAANAIAINAFAGDNYAHDLDLSPDGETLYVSRGHLADVAAFDLTQTPATLVWTAPMDGVRADHMTISADGEHLYVSDLMMDQVIAIDTSDGTRAGTVPTGDYAHGVSVLVPEPGPSTMSTENEEVPGERCAFLEGVPASEEPSACVYVASIGDVVLQPREAREDRPDEVDAVANEPYRLTIADADTLEVVRTLEVPDGIRPAAFDLTTERKVMYYQESMFHGIVEYDIEEGREIRRVQLPAPYETEEADYSFEAPHHGLALSPDGETLCAAGRASDYAAIVSTETMLPEAIVDVGDAPSWAITGPQGQTCWIANAGSEATDEQPPADTVSVIGYEEEATLATIDTDAGPKHLLAAHVPASVTS